MPIGESPGRRQQRWRHTVATGRRRRLFFGWEAAGGGDGGAALVFNGDGLKIYVFFDLFSLCSAFFIFNSVLFGLLIARILIRPVNLAYFIKMYMSFLL